MKPCPSSRSNKHMFICIVMLPLLPHRSWPPLSHDVYKLAVPLVKVWNRLPKRGKAARASMNQALEPFVDTCMFNLRFSSSAVTLWCVLLKMRGGKKHYIMSDCCSPPPSAARVGPSVCVWLSLCLSQSLNHSCLSLCLPLPLFQPLPVPTGQVAC